MMWLVAGLSSLVFLLASDADTKWQALKLRLDSGDTSLDFTEARMAYAESSAYSSRDSKSSDAVKLMNDLYDMGEMAKACSIGRAALELAPLHPSLNGIMSVLYLKRSMTDSSEYYNWRFVGVLESINSSGPGTSADSAKVVIAVYEEYALLRYLRLNPNGQSLVRTKSGSSVDAMTCKDEGGSDVTMYFNVDISMRSLIPTPEKK